MSVRFDAATDRISYTATNPPSTTAFTITAWAMVVTDTDSNATIARLHASTGGSTIATWATGSDGLSGPNYFTTSGSISNATNFAAGSWRKVAICATGTSGKSYVATVGGGTEVDSGTIATGQPTGITLGGRAVGDGTEWFNGRLAYVRVWSVELTQSEIEAEWASATPVKTANLWADWPLTVHTDLTDHSGNGRNLTAGSTAVTTEADPPVSSGTTGVLAASIPMQTATVAATVADAGELAGAVPLQTAQLAATVTDQAELAGTIPLQTVSVDASVQQTGALAASVPMMQATLAADVRTGAGLAGSIPMQQASITTDVRADAALAATIPMQGVQVAADVTTAGVLAGEIPLPTVQIAAGSGPNLGLLAGAIPLQTVAIAVAVTDPAVLAGVIPMQTVRFTTTPQASGTLHASPVRDLAAATAGPVFDVAGLHARIT